MPQHRLVAAAAQMPFAWAAAPQEYFDRMHAPVAQAATLGAGLVVLPHYTGDMLVGVQVPGEPEASRAELAARGGFASWQECVRRTAETTAQFYVHTFQSLAQRYGMYILPGTISLPGEASASSADEPPAVYHASFLFGPDGEVLGEQRMLFPVAGAGDLASGFGAGLMPLDTPIGRVGIIVGDDAQHREVERSAVTEGCIVVLNPAAQRERAASGNALSWLGNFVAAGIYVVVAPLAGGGFVGRASIYGPRGTGVNGVLARAPGERGADVVCAEIDVS